MRPLLACPEDGGRRGGSQSALSSRRRPSVWSTHLLGVSSVMFTFIVLSAFIEVIDASGPPPVITSISDRVREYVEGEDILLTCVVTNLGSHTVFWAKKDGRTKKILTVNKKRLTSDFRYSVMHDEGAGTNNTFISTSGEVWVLVINKAEVTDSGTYMCQVNSRPQVMQHYQVTVKTESEGLIHPEVRSNHNYTQCCYENGVKANCLGFCTIHNILEGETGIQPEECEDQFPNIVRCMADYRNHVPCCEKQNIPDICQDLCRGDYTMQDDYVRSHFSCTAYTEATLLCISEGIETLPMPPESVTARVKGPTTVLVEWSPPRNDSPTIVNYIINVKALKRFDPPVDIDLEGPEFNETLDNDDDLHYVPHRMQVKLPATQTQAKLEKLSPLTWYEISVISQNHQGSSTALYHQRILTLPQGHNFSEAAHPKLPDVQKCCVDKGVQHDRCLVHLCNPNTRYILEPDMIVCAPWASEAFSCLADGFDHSPCCRSRGLPDVCVELCSGNVTKIDFKYFKCVDYYSDFRNCLMQGYGVLPGPPLKVLISNVHPTFALISWSPPDVLPESVTSYHAYYRPIEPSRECGKSWYSSTSSYTYRGLYASRSPHVIENLCPDTEYEVYVQAFNKYGTSDPSTRILFKTTTVKKELKLETSGYSIESCCNNTNVSPACMSLCSYNARMSHVRALATVCRPDMTKLLRCGVGGRNHGPCCARRGVPDSCLNLCSGTITSDFSTPTACMPYVGNIMMCLEEGVNILPGPVWGLHATSVKDGGITLVWEQPRDNINVTRYQVHYQNVDVNSASHAVYQYNNTYNTTITAAQIDGLTVGGLYNFFVVALNKEGASLPSSVITLNLTEEHHTGTPVAAVPSSPHSLTLDSKTATTLTIIWQPPALALPIDRFSYTVYFRPVNNSEEPAVEFNTTTTASTALHLNDLTPNTQYVIYATATNDMGTSRPSETLLAWTDPAYPAFVETPTVHPTNMIMEGNSMTVLCIAMGSPPPTVTLYISGVQIHQDETRHMVTVISNVTRDMTEISCYADNGYGTPMQSSVSITITRRPKIKAPKNDVTVTVGKSAQLICEVDAWPQPSVAWWRDPATRTPVIHGGNIALAVETAIMREGVSLMTLTIKKANYSDAGSYQCFASNTLGEFTQTIKVNVNDAMAPLKIDVYDCCTSNNVSDACIDACLFEQLDFQKVKDRDECIPDFSKLMKCAADGSDHRSCCNQMKVPAQCLDWCRGEPVAHHRECILNWAPTILSCFHEGQDTLPGPPISVKVTSLTSSSARVSWAAPDKNPQAVELYRVFWRAIGERLAKKNDTASKSIVISGMKEGTEYEVAVKAGNHKGTSVLTPTIKFYHSLSSVSSAIATQGGDIGIVIGMVVLVLVILCALVAGGWWVWERRLLCAKAAANGGISFENPSYIREQNGDTVQIAETPNGSINGTITSEVNGSRHNNGNIVNNENIWNTQPISSSNSNNIPGFEEDGSNGKGGYKRFSS